MQDSPSPCYIDIFAGCGGLSLGLHNAGWKGLFAIEKNPMAFATLKHNLIDRVSHFDWPCWLPEGPHDINEVLAKYRNELTALRGKVDLVAGGPPCQGFSFAGRRQEHDIRNQLVNSYVEFVDVVQPTMIFFENVRGFTSQFIRKSTEGKIYSDEVIRKLEDLNYNVKYDIVDFSKFGIPQRRKRFILIGIRDGDAEQFFDKLIAHRDSFLWKKGLNIKITASEALSDLERINGEYPSPDTDQFMAGLYGPVKSNYQALMRRKDSLPHPDSHRFVNHRNRTVEKFKYIIDNFEKNKNIDAASKASLNLRKKCIIPMHPDMPSPTLTTLPDDYIHYCEPRVLTVREFARLQSFDDWFEFKEKYTTGGTLRTVEVPRYSQVGNAIPPMFVEQAGYVMKAMI